MLPCLRPITDDQAKNWKTAVHETALVHKTKAAWDLYHDGHTAANVLSCTLPGFHYVEDESDWPSFRFRRSELDPERYAS